MGGRLAASRLMAAPKESAVACSGSKCTVTLAYPAIAWCTSRRFFSAAASAIARVLSAVSSRVPSSARTAASPSGWTRIFTGERCGGMCADKDGVEHARHDPDAQHAGAREPDCPTGDDRGRRHVPRHEIAAHSAQRGGEVEQVARPTACCEPRRGVRHEKERDEPPRKGQREKRDDVRVRLTQRSERGGERVQDQREGQRDQKNGE